MASKHEPIDLTTLEAVHRLLTETEFATAAELAARVGPALTAPGATPPAASVTPSAPADGAAALPRRR